MTEAGDPDRLVAPQDRAEDAPDRALRPETLDDVPHPFRGATELFVKPGHRFRWVDVLITNFHLPRSSLLLLVAALAPGRWRKAYEEAVAAGYRFYSYGDANWIERTS